MSSGGVWETELKTLGPALVQLRERESEITSVSGALAGNRAGIRSRKPQSCWGADLGRRPDLCVDTPSVTYLSDMHVEEGAGYGNQLPLRGAVQPVKLTLGIAASQCH